MELMRIDNPPSTLQFQCGESWLHRRAAVFGSRSSGQQKDLLDRSFVAIISRRLVIYSIAINLISIILSGDDLVEMAF